MTADQAGQGLAQGANRSDLMITEPVGPKEEQAIDQNDRTIPDLREVNQDPADSKANPGGKTRKKVFLVHDQHQKQPIGERLNPTNLRKKHPYA